MLKTFHSIRFDQKRANFGHTTMALKRSVTISEIFGKVKNRTLYLKTVFNLLRANKK